MRVLLCFAVALAACLAAAPEAKADHNVNQFRRQQFVRGQFVRHNFHRQQIVVIPQVTHLHTQALAAPCVQQFGDGYDAGVLGLGSCHTQAFAAPLAYGVGGYGSLGFRAPFVRQRFVGGGFGGAGIGGIFGDLLGGVIAKHFGLGGLRRGFRR